MGPKLPAWTTSALRGQDAATDSMAITASISEPPWPPSASLMVMPSSPCAAIFFAASQGYSVACARSRAPAVSSLAAKRRTASAKAACSALKLKSM
jgi:hypothetical protein